MDKSTQKVLIIAVAMVLLVEMLTISSMEKEKIRQDAETERALKQDKKKTWNLNFNKDKK